MSIGLSALSCADADPHNISVAAAASINDFIIGKIPSNLDCKARPERSLGPSNPYTGAFDRISQKTRFGFGRYMSVKTYSR